MVNYQLDNAKANNNRMNAEPAVAFEKADLLAIDANGEMVLADAADGQQGQCVGVALTPAFDLSIYDGMPEEEFLKNKQMEEKNVILGEGDRATAFYNDILLEDVDGDAALTPNHPVYLGEGGGLTQTPPATSGSLVQIVGVAQSDTHVLVQVQPSDEIVA